MTLDEIRRDIAKTCEWALQRLKDRDERIAEADEKFLKGLRINPDLKESDEN